MTKKGIHSYQEIKSLDAGSGERIPTLDEVLDFVHGKMKINIELKVTDIEDKVLSAIKARDMISDVTISSFLHGTLISMKALDTRVSTAVLVSKIRKDIISYLIELEAGALNPDYKNITSDIVAEAHRNNIQVFPWTVNEEGQMKTLFEMGVDGIITNYPSIALKILNNLHN